MIFSTPRGGPRDQLDAIFETERERIVTDHRDVDACRTLWRTVIERAVDDLRFLRRHRSRADLKKHQQERLRRIHESPPGEFIQGAWFEQICDFLQVSPTRVRRAIEEAGGIAA